MVAGLHTCVHAAIQGYHYIHCEYIHAPHEGTSYARILDFTIIVYKLDSL